MPTPTRNPGPPSWVEIKKSVLNYQAYLKTLPVDPQLRRKAFVIDKETIDRLFRLGTGSPKAIRFYVGSEPDGTALRLFPVACEQRTDGSGRTYFHEIDLPKTLPDDSTPTTLSTRTTTMEVTTDSLPPTEEARPCPSDCGSDNFLNPTP